MARRKAKTVAETPFDAAAAARAGGGQQAYLGDREDTTVKDKGHIAVNISPVLKNLINSVCSDEGIVQAEVVERALKQYFKTYDFDAKIAAMRRQIATL